MEKLKFVVATTNAGASFFSRHNGPAVESDLGVLDASIDADRNEIVELAHDWDQLRISTNSASRFNSPAGFMRRLDSVRPDDEQPFAMLLKIGDGVSGVVVGGIKRCSVSNTIAKVKIPFARLRTAYVGESSIIHGGGQDLLTLLIDRLVEVMKDGGFDLLKVHDVVQGTGLHARMAEVSGVNGLYSSRTKVRWQTQVLDPVTRKRAEHHSGKTRRNIRLRDKKLVEAFHGDVVLEMINEPSQVDCFFRESASIASQSYHAALDIGIQEHKSKLRDYLYELAEERTLRGYILRAGGEAIAYAQGDLQGGVLYLWSTAYLPKYKELAPGIVLINRIVDSLAEEGIALLDFGWGDSAYKQRLGSHKLDVVDYRLYSDRFLPRIACALDRLLDSVNRQLQHLAERGGRIDKLRVAWRTYKMKKMAIGSAPPASAVGGSGDNSDETGNVPGGR